MGLISQLINDNSHQLARKPMAQRNIADKWCFFLQPKLDLQVTFLPEKTLQAQHFRVLLPVTTVMKVKVLFLQHLEMSQQTPNGKVNHNFVGNNFRNDMHAYGRFAVAM